MSYKKFGKAPFKMNFKHLINQSTGRKKQFYSYLRLLNTLMKIPEGTQVNSNRYGLYLLTNNFLIALHAHIKAMESKNALNINFCERQITEIWVYFRQIIAQQDPSEIKGWDIISSNLRFYVGYILWSDLKQTQKYLDTLELDSNRDKADSNSQKSKEQALKTKDSISCLVIDTKHLISILKLEYVIIHLDNLNNQSDRPISLLAFLTKGEKSFSSIHKEILDVRGQIRYATQSRIAHGAYHSLTVSRFEIKGGLDYLNDLILTDEFGIFDHQVDMMCKLLTSFFRQYWPKEFDPKLFNG